ncbi:MAG: DUF983 domain-containing protein [Pseudomonadota bacterium]
MTKPSPILAGLRRKCGRCGKGDLFDGYLKFAPACSVCGQDFSVADTADGPAFFVGFLALIVLAPFYFVLPMLTLPIGLMALGYIAISAIAIGMCLALLPVFKATLFNLQIEHRAEEARFEDLGGD